MSIKKGSLYIAGGGSGSGRNIGDIFYTTRTDTSLSGAVECNGGTYSTADYAGAGSIGELLAGGKLDYISLSDYATAISTKGYCDKIGWDGTGTTSFRVPKLAPRRYVVKVQEPTADNNYTWYRLYNDGWVEQGGRFDNGTGVRDKSGIVTSFPIEMADDKYYFNGYSTKNINATGVRTVFTTIYYRTETQIIWGWYGLSTSDVAQYGVWQVSGQSAIVSDPTERAMFQLFNSTTDEAVATVGTVVAQVGELRNMSNITTTGKETVVGWGMPDYSAGVIKSHNTLYQAETDGIVRLCIGTNNHNIQFRYGNDSSVSNVLSISNGTGVTAITGDFFVPKGTYYQTTGTLYVASTMSNTIIFYPCKK